MILRLVRKILGSAILLGDRLFPAQKIQPLSPEQKLILAPILAKLELYQFVACPFCVKVRRALARLDLTVSLRNCEQGPYREELVHEGGQLQVPCLKIKQGPDQTKWLYESDAIIAYFENLVRTIQLSA